MVERISKYVQAAGQSYIAIIYESPTDWKWNAWLDVPKMCIDTRWDMFMKKHTYIIHTMFKHFVCHKIAFHPDIILVHKS